MTYCLVTEDGKVRVEIRCTLANRPETVGDLVLGVHDGTIMMVKPQKLPIRAINHVEEEFGVDWERTGTGGRFINWIPIENLQ